MVGHDKKHSPEHNEGGIDEIAQGSLLPQIPTVHNPTHRVGQPDALSELDATQIGDGSVSLTEFYMLDGVNTASSLVTKDQLDAVVQGLDWQESVIERRADPPASPTEGDRYLVIATATGAWTGWEDSIVEWDGSAWIRIAPDPGFITLVEDENKWYMYDGTTWGPFSEAISHGDLLGLGDDDHTQYLLINGTRAMTGALDMGTNNISETGNIIPHAGNQELGSQALPFNILNTNRITGTGAGLPGGGTLVINTLDNPNGRVLMNPILHINNRLDLNGLFHRGLALGKGIFYPKMTSQEAEPSIEDGELMIWDDTTAGAEKLNLLFRKGTTQYRVELYPTA